MNKVLLIKNILIDENLTQEELATKLGVTKQCLSQIILGKRSIGSKVNSGLKLHYPQYFKDDNEVSPEWLVNIRHSKNLSQDEMASKLGISQSLYSKIEKGERNITDSLLERINKVTKSNPNSKTYQIRYMPEIQLPNVMYIPNNNDYVVIDKKLLEFDDIQINPSRCVIVSICDDSLSPLFDVGDKCIVDTSFNKLINNQIFAFVFENQCYIRKIKILPNKIKCVSVNNDEDTFSIENKGLKIIGLIIPKVRF